MTMMTDDDEIRFMQADTDPNHWDEIIANSPPALAAMDHLYLAYLRARKEMEKSVKTSDRDRKIIRELGLVIDELKALNLDHANQNYRLKSQVEIFSAELKAAKAKAEKLACEVVDRDRRIDKCHDMIEALNSRIDEQTAEIANLKNAAVIDQRATVLIARRHDNAVARIKELEAQAAKDREVHLGVVADAACAWRWNTSLWWAFCATLILLLAIFRAAIR